MADNSVTIYGLAPGHKLPPATLEQVEQVATERANRAVAAAGILTTAQVEAIARRIMGTAPPAPDEDLPTTPARRAIILGDSHSDWTWPQAGGIWWWQTAADLAGVTVVDNVAVGGMTTQDAITGWGADTANPAPSQIKAAEASDANLAVMQFGGNDLANGLGLEAYRANMATLIKRLQATGKRVLVVASPPLFPTMHESRGTEYEEYRKAAEAVAKANGAYYGDGWDLVGTGPGGSMPSKYDSGDGVHLNGEGQLAYGRAMAARLQQVAAVADPYDGTRDKPWYTGQWVQGDAAAVTVGTGPSDALFKGRESALVVSRAGDVVDNCVLYYPLGGPGTRWEVSFAYRVESSAYPGKRAYLGLADWPMGREEYLPYEIRSEGQEGVRRVITTVPADATDGRVFALQVPHHAGDLRIRVSALGIKQLA